MSEDLFIGLGAGGLLALAVLVAASVAVLYGWRRSERAHRYLGRISTLVSSLLLLYSLWLVVALHQGWLGDWFTRLSGWKGTLGVLDFHSDALSLWFILLANVIAFAASWGALAYMESGKQSNHAPGGQDDDQGGGESDRFARWHSHPAFLQACLNGFYLTMLLVPILDNLIGLWIGIELTTLASALVVGYRNTPAAWEAAWKYLVITSAGIVLALLGTVFLAHAVNPAAVPPGSSEAVMNWSYLMGHAQDRDFWLNTDFVILAFLLVLVGYGTKAGLAPLHTWLPDGHGEAPAPVSALLSGVLLKLAVYAILRFYTITNAALGSIAMTSNLLFGAGLLSLIVATPFILKRNRFKRVLAYHSVEHMGIICFGIGIGNPFALAGALLHTFNHAVTKALMFLAYGHLERQYRRARESAAGPGAALDDREITGVLNTLPWTGNLLALGGFALVGTPPFGIFVSELMILWGALGALIALPGGKPLPAGPPHWAIIAGVLIFMLTTTLIFFGLARHLSDHLLGKRVQHLDPQKRPAQQFDTTKIDERWFRDLIPLLFLAVLVVCGVLAVLWSGLLEPCVAILLPPGKGG